jgi:tetratricopeptide (TPR) repeat protein
MSFAENPVVSKNLPSSVLQDIGIRFIYHLVKRGKFAEAAKKCGETLKEKDKYRWEDFIVYFLDHGQLQAILPFIPQMDPQLSPAVYELVLNTFLQKDSKTLHKTVQAWPTSLYNPQAVINAVDDKLREQPNNEDLLKVKALLHEDLGQYEEALKIYLQQGHFEVFELIQKRKLYTSLVGNLMTLMKLGSEETVNLLIAHRTEPPLQVERVVKVLDSTHTAEYLHKYLDGLFQKDPKAGGQYHQRQVELYATYDKEKLLPFLRSCTDIPLQKALQVCEKHNRYEEMVFLLARMGNPKAALELVIKKLEDVDKAIEFAMEEGDDDLWDALIHLSISNPSKFIDLFLFVFFTFTHKVLILYTYKYLYYVLTVRQPCG